MAELFDSVLPYLLIAAIYVTQIATFLVFMLMPSKIGNAHVTIPRENDPTRPPYTPTQLLF